MKYKTAIIYKATNILNSKCYIGKGVKGLTKRRRGHLQAAARGSHSNFHNAIRKYGAENFQWEILFECPREKCSNKELAKLEKEFVKKYKSNLRKHGYNMTPGGEGGNTLSNHPNRLGIIKKLSLALKGRTKTIYKLISPQGEEMTVNGLNEVCKKYNLKRSHLITIAKNKRLQLSGRSHHKGWKCEYLTEPQYGTASLKCH